MKKWKLYKCKLFATTIALTSIGGIGISSTLTSCGLIINQIKNSVLPTVKMFTNYRHGNYLINDKTSIAVNLSDIPDDDILYPNHSRKQMAREIFQNIAGEYYAKLLDTKHPLTSHPEFKSSITNADHEIAFAFCTTDHLDNLPEITVAKYPEAYQIDISNRILVHAFNESGWIAAAKTLLQLQVSNDNGVPYGKISDWPKTKQRGIEVDFSGRGYPLSFVADLVKTMSWSKLNTLALRFASGGMRLDCKKIDEAPPTSGVQDGTWFKVNWSQFGSSGEDYFNLNTNYRDNSPTWNWSEGKTSIASGFSDFGNVLNLAFKEGVNIIPEINIFTHAWFLTDLTRPKDSSGNYVDDGKNVTDSSMKEKDFAIWDDSTSTDYPNGKRIPDTLDLRGEKSGSKAVIDLCQRLVKYLAERFTSVGNYNKHAILSFGIGGDEYIETLDNQWTSHPNNWTDDSKQKIVNSVYTFSKTMYETLQSTNVNNIAEWSDSLLKEYPYNNWPNATIDNWNNIVPFANVITIKHWWSKYGNAPIASFVKPYQAGMIGGGIKKIVNYNSDQLYFSDDESNTSTAPTAKSIFNNFHPGIFAGNAGTYLDNNGSNQDEYPSWLQGSMLSVWWDWSPHVATMIDGPLKAFAQKTWNGTNTPLNFDTFNKLTSKLGRAPLIGWN